MAPRRPLGSRSWWNAGSATVAGEETERRGLEQTATYLDRCGAEAGHIVPFDCAPNRPRKDKIYRRETTDGETQTTIWGM